MDSDGMVVVRCFAGRPRELGTSQLEEPRDGAVGNARAWWGDGFECVCLSFKSSRRILTTRHWFSFGGLAKWNG